VEVVPDLHWRVPFSWDGLPEFPGAGLMTPDPHHLDRLRGLARLLDTVDESPRHKHLLAVYCLQCDLPFIAVYFLRRAVGEDVELHSAWVDLSAAYLRAGRPELAGWSLTRVLPEGLGLPGIGPARPYADGGPEQSEVRERLLTVTGLLHRRRTEAEFLRLRVAACEENAPTPPPGSPPEAASPSAPAVALHATALMELGRLLDVAEPFEEAVRLLEGAVETVATAQLLELLAKARIASGPVPERDRALATLRDALPESPVLRTVRAGTVEGRRLLEMEADCEAMVLAGELSEGNDGTAPLDRLRWRARASDFPAPYLVASVRATLDSGRAEQAVGLSEVAEGHTALTPKHQLTLARACADHRLFDRARAHARRVTGPGSTAALRAQAMELLKEIDDGA
jgi:hypothetical protein